MPELPDVVIYLEALEARILGQSLEKIRLANPFLLRSVSPPLSEAAGKRVTGLRRLGKRIVIGLEHELFLVIHLMIAGRFRWKEAGAKIPGKLGLAAFDFSSGTLLLTEAGTRRRASLHLVAGEAALADHDPGGLEVLQAALPAFAEALNSQNRMTKRMLTDPATFSGIGNAYSDEILHRAQLSPFKQTRQLDEGETARLYRATREILTEWSDRLRQQAGGKFPEKVTAFHKEMAVHGKFGQPCPVCGKPVQRVVYANNEMNYCALCQTGGKMLADRALSRLLKNDWPRTIDEIEPPAAAAPLREGD
ncbi:MAG: DNA-formamidopyrimidine glycosylase family protein [bacterium]